jgi:hypothetical protein
MKNKVINYIWVTTQFEGYHKYPDAPKEVEFLKNEHRHIFKIKIWIEVFNNDRDIEFIKLKRKINEELSNWSTNLGMYSCEMMADDLYRFTNKEYPKRKIKISVSEDGENGCEKEY